MRFSSHGLLKKILISSLVKPLINPLKTSIQSVLAWVGSVKSCILSNVLLCVGCVCVCVCLCACVNWWLIECECVFLSSHYAWSVSFLFIHQDVTICAQVSIPFTFLMWNPSCGLPNCCHYCISYKFSPLWLWLPAFTLKLCHETVEVTPQCMGPVEIGKACNRTCSSQWFYKLFSQEILSLCFFIIFMM